jgi:hypothetical protein
MQPIKPASLTACVLAGLCGTAAAQLAFDFSIGLPDGGQIPDGNLAGWSDTRTLSGLPSGSILDLNVRLSVSGGYNGDLCGYLTHGSGFTILVNRVGRTASNPFGYENAGLSVTFDDEAVGSADIHSYQNMGGYSVFGGAVWRPDARCQSCDGARNPCTQRLPGARSSGLIPTASGRCLSPTCPPAR